MPQDDLYTNPTVGISHTDAEICLSCWYFTDDTGVVLRLAAKAYALTGSDEEKLSILKALSATDHLTATHATVPKRFRITVEHGTFEGAAPVSVLQQNAISYFDDLIEKVMRELPDNIHATNDEPAKFRMEFIEPFLWISTCVYEAQDGSLIARVSQ